MSEIFKTQLEERGKRGHRQHHFGQRVDFCIRGIATLVADAGIPWSRAQGHSLELLFVGTDLAPEGRRLARAEGDLPVCLTGQLKSTSSWPQALGYRIVSNNNKGSVFKSC